MGLFSRRGFILPPLILREFWVGNPRSRPGRDPSPHDAPDTLGFSGKLECRHHGRTHDRVRAGRAFEISPIADVEPKQSRTHGKPNPRSLQLGTNRTGIHATLPATRFH